MNGRLFVVVALCGLALTGAVPLNKVHPKPKALKIKEVTKEATPAPAPMAMMESTAAMHYEAMLEAFEKGDTDSMNVIVKMVDEKLMPELKTAVKSLQDELAAAYAKFDTCTSAKASCDSAISAMYTSVGTARTLAETKTKEKEAASKVTSTCEGVSDVTLSGDDATALGDAAILAYTTAIKKRIDTYNTAAKAAKDASTSMATELAKLETKTGECNGFCTSCTTDAKAAYDALKAKALRLQPSQIEDVKTYTLIRCVAVESGKDNRADVLAGCRTATADTSWVTYDLKDAPSISCVHGFAEVPKALLELIPGDSPNSVTCPYTSIKYEKGGINFVEDKEGVKSMNLERVNGVIETSTGEPGIGAEYTQAAWVWWRESNSGWRTLLRNSHDHIMLVKDGSDMLGMYSNRDGNFRPAGVPINKGSWQFVVVSSKSVTGAGGTRGTGTVYVGHKGKLAQVGRVDRVASGTKFYRIGWDAQNPGWISELKVFNQALTPAQVLGLYAQGAKKHGHPVPSAEVPEAFGIFVDGTYSTDTPTGWGKPADQIKYGTGGLVGHNWHDLTVQVDFGASKKICGVHTDTNKGFKVLYKNSEGTFVEVDSFPDSGGDRKYSTPFTAQVAKLMWVGSSSTSGTSGFHAEFISCLRPVEFGTCYNSAGGRPLGEAIIVKDIASCVDRAKGYKYMGLGCPHGSGWECWRGNAINGGAKVIEMEECSGSPTRGELNGGNNGHCSGYPVLTFYDSYKGFDFPTGGWHREPVFEMSKIEGL